MELRPYLSSQDTFDFVATHIFTQGKRAFENEGCKYRTSDGLKCAAGCLIPDNLYSPDMDQGKKKDLSIHSIIRKHSSIDLYVAHNAGLIRSLQIAHDTNDDRWIDESRMKKSLSIVAICHGLNSKVLENLHFPMKGG